MKRVTFSLADQTVHLLEALAARIANGNASIVAEVALQKIAQEPMAETQRLVNLNMRERMASTRNGWMRAFWQTLGELMGQPDGIDNVRAPRSFTGSYAALLMHNIGHEDQEDDPFHPYVGPQPALSDSLAPQQWMFERSASPVAAAKTVATKLQEYSPSHAESERR
jgi:hypothetical protein